MVEEQRDEFREEIRKLKKCMKFALDLRPLPTDPLQQFVKEVCPDVLKEWEDIREK